jgi:acyl-CoA reductase-like NAD-dependent aldehyde dehydrogenase
MFHLPATSARLSGAGVVVVVVVDEVDDAIALVLSTEALSFFAHPARTAAQQQIAMRVVRCGVNIQPPV